MQRAHQRPTAGDEISVWQRGRCQQLPQVSGHTGDDFETVGRACVGLPGPPCRASRRLGRRVVRLVVPGLGIAHVLVRR
jgi:hypothetical protein